MTTLTCPWKRRPSSRCGAAHRARASAHSGCLQSGLWPHHGTTSAVEQEPQTKTRSLGLLSSFPGVLFVALEGRRAGRVGRVVLPRRPSWCRRSRSPNRRFTSPLTRGSGPSGIGSSSSCQLPGRFCERPAFSRRFRSSRSEAARQGSGSTSARSMSRIGPWPPCSGIHAVPQAGQVTRGSSAAVAIWRSREAIVAASALRAVCSRRGVGKQNRMGALRVRAGSRRAWSA